MDPKKEPAESRVLELFEEGKRFTEDLLRENERLRRAVASERQERKELEKSYVQVDVPRLQQKLAVAEDELQQLRAENQDLREQFNSIEEENREFADRYVQVERQNSDLLNLYVASYRLHSTLDDAEVLQIINEIVINMIGAEVFGVYLIDESAQELVRISVEGEGADIPQRAALGDGVLGTAASSGELYTAPDGTDLQGGGQDPIACIPLKVGERAMGLIAIYQLLMQKDVFQSVDFQLFELLGGHAATAVYVAKLYSLSERKRTTLESFIQLLRDDAQAAPKGA